MVDLCPSIAEMLGDNLTKYTGKTLTFSPDEEDIVKLVFSDISDEYPILIEHYQAVHNRLLKSDTEEVRTGALASVVTSVCVFVSVDKFHRQLMEGN